MISITASGGGGDGQAVSNKNDLGVLNEGTFEIKDGTITLTKGKPSNVEFLWRGSSANIFYPSTSGSPFSGKACQLEYKDDGKIVFIPGTYTGEEFEVKNSFNSGSGTVVP